MAKNNNARRAGDFGEKQRDGLTNGNQLLSADTCSDSTIRTLALVREGREWVAACPEAWNAAQRFALDRAREGRRVTWHEIATVLSRLDYLDHRTGANARLDNTIGPLLMRWLVVLRPEIAPFVELRRSQFDAVEVGGPYALH